MTPTAQFLPTLETTIVTDRDTIQIQRWGVNDYDAYFVNGDYSVRGTPVDIIKEVNDFMENANEISNRFSLVDLKFIDMYHFQMWEGKFEDGVTGLVFYANLSNFDTRTFGASDVRIYSESYEDLYDPEEYEITFPTEGERKLKEMLLEAIKERKNTMEQTSEFNYALLTEG